jgi:Dolichyl-phosphate-mannose-protein mannosyltransferase
MADFQSPYLRRPYPDSQRYPPRQSDRRRSHPERKPQALPPPAPGPAWTPHNQARRYQRPEDVSENNPTRGFDELRSRAPGSIKPTPNEPTGPRVTEFNWRSATLVTISIELGLGCVQIADQRAFHGDNYGTNLDFFWCGLILVFLPAALRVIMRKTSRAERITIILLAALAFYIMKIENSPYVFTYNDEYIHWVNTQHILNNGHIFQFNPILPTAAYYPGLAAVTASLVRLTGLSIFVSGLIVIGVMRIIISACLYLVAERMTGSSRAAAVCSIIYAANPMFLFWSAQYAYEDLGLPLAAFTVWWLCTTRKNESRAPQIVTVLAIGALTVTHHISAFALTAVFAMWFLVELIARKPREQRRYVGAFTLLAGSMSTIWFFFVARPAVGYLIGENIKPAFQEMIKLISDHAGRHLYSGGPVSPRWYILLSFAAIAVIMLALPPALYRSWGMITSSSKGSALCWNTSLVVAAIIAISFPFTLLPRLTSVGGPISARTSEYVFMGLGCTLGLLAVESAKSRLTTSNRLYRALGKLFRPIDFLLASWRGTLVLTAMVTIIFFGEIGVGSNYNQLLPPSSNPSGYPLAIQPDVISAAIWARDHLGANQPFATDDVDSLALATYGDENPEPEDEIFAIFFGDSLAGLPAQQIKESGTRYILVDWRMTYGLPTNPGEYYFSQWEPQAGDYTKPFNGDYLKKFTTYTCSHMIYHSGPIQIFDVSGIANGTCAPRLISTDTVAVRSLRDRGTSGRKASLWYRAR